MDPDLVNSGTPMWVFDGYEAMAGPAMMVATFLLLTGAGALAGRALGGRVRGGWVPDGIGLGWLATTCVGLFFAWGASAPPPGGEFCYTPSTLVQQLPTVCVATPAAAPLTGPVLWLLVPSVVGLTVRACAALWWRALGYGALAMGLAVWASESWPQGFLPATAVFPGGFAPSIETAALLAGSVDGLVGTTLGTVAFAIFHVYLFNEELLPTTTETQSPPA